MSKLIDIYTATYSKLQKFIEANQEIFLRKQQLENELLEKERLLKEYIKETRKDMENSQFKAIYIPRYKKYYDYNRLMELSNSVEKELIQKTATIIETDKKKLEEYAQKNLLRPELLQESYKEEFISANVYIKPKETDKNQPFNKKN